VRLTQFLRNGSSYPRVICSTKCGGDDSVFCCLIFPAGISRGREVVGHGGRNRSNWCQAPVAPTSCLGEASDRQELSFFVQYSVVNMAAIPKPIDSANDWREHDPLLTPEQVSKRLNTSLDWVWDHSSRKTPILPVIRFGDGPRRAGMLRYRASKIEEFILEQERFANSRRRNSGCKIA
jgi:hypothetical protein